jgi:hypothetical protein
MIQPKGWFEIDSTERGPSPAVDEHTSTPT